VQTAHRQSAEQGHTLGTEIKVLMLHGLLHLAGYDHETDAGEMQRSERSLRKRLGLPLGLIERASSPTLSQKTRKDGARDLCRTVRGARLSRMRWQRWRRVSLPITGGHDEQIV
jgi:probable rRNA maturation factor